jgi:hypothetical protein
VRGGLEEGIAGTRSSAVITLRPGRTAVLLAGVAAVLVSVSVILNTVKVLAGEGSFKWLVDLFRLNQERNIPSFFSGELCALSALLLAWVWVVKRGGSASRPATWLALSFLFGFLAFDELFAVHEELIDPLQERFELTGVLHYAWVLVYGLLVVVVGLAFWPVWRGLSTRLRTWFSAAALLYITGALVFEMLQGALYTGSEGDLVAGFLYTVEESLEQAGLIMFIYALLSLLSDSRASLAIGHDPRPAAPPPS